MGKDKAIEQDKGKGKDKDVAVVATPPVTQDVKATPAVTTIPAAMPLRVAAEAGGIYRPAKAKSGWFFVVKAGTVADAQGRIALVNVNPTPGSNGMPATMDGTQQADLLVRAVTSDEAAKCERLINPPAKAVKANEMPDAGTILKANARGIAYEAVVQPDLTVKVTKATLKGTATDAKSPLVGRTFKSLSAAGKEMTGGVSCNGWALFGLRATERKAGDGATRKVGSAAIMDARLSRLEGLIETIAKSLGIAIPDPIKVEPIVQTATPAQAASAS
jgi:hypothetical protein